MSKTFKQDLTSQQFGNWIVLEFFPCDGRAKWTCQCNCNNKTIRVIREDSLKNGSSKSCGCSNYEDLTNQQFGRLTVLKKSNQLGKWTCICSCKDQIICDIDPRKLKNGHTKSCGCLNKEIVSKLKSKDLTRQTFGLLLALESTDKRIDGSVVWKCQCSCEEKSIYYVSAKKLISGHTNSCGCLNSSVGELYIKQLLIENKVNFETEYKFSDLYSIKGGLLRFDFLISDNPSYLIEFDGEQHFRSSNRFSIKDVKEIQERDKIKNEYCIKNNISLIRIPFWERQNITIDILKLETTSKQFIVSNINHNEIVYQQYLNSKNY